MQSLVLRIHRRLFAIAVAVALLGLPLLTAQAIPPARVDHYHVIPSASSFTQTGGFAGVENRYRLEGEFDFQRLWEIGDATEPNITPYAKFDNADMRAPLGPLLPAFTDVDYLLNLEGLAGELLPLGAPFDVYRFEGRINDNLAASPLELDSTIELFTAIVGPWLYFHGSTTPPPLTADFFQYEIQGIARTRPWADVNGDNRVDAADYTSIRDGQSISGVSLSDWQIQYGEALPANQVSTLLASLAHSNSTATTVPEPTSAMLLSTVAMLLGSRCKRN